VWWRGGGGRGSPPAATLFTAKVIYLINYLCFTAGLWTNI
jgi:hypothetical protein